MRRRSTVEILEGHRTESSGSVSVLGINPSTAGRELRDRIGIVLQSSAVEPQLTVREALRFYGSTYRRQRGIDDLIELIGLTDQPDGLASFTAVSATYTSLVNVVPIRRDEGILKRWHSTPIPPYVYLGGWVIGPGPKDLQVGAARPFRPPARRGAV